MMDNMDNTTTYSFLNMRSSGTLIHAFSCTDPDYAQTVKSPSFFINNKAEFPRKIANSSEICDVKKLNPFSITF
jgi:hypothetical protein